jgi:excisionase family DNA binding protein
MKQTEPRYLDIKTLSRYSCTSPSKIRLYIKEHGLPAYLIRGKMLIKREEFEQWLEGYRYDPDQDLNEIVDGVMEEFAQ